MSLLLVGAAACGSGSGDDDDDDDVPGADGGGGGGPDGGGGGGGPDASGEVPGSFTVTWGPMTVPPGENTMCVVKKVGNTEQLRVGSIHNVLGATSHHFIVYRTNDTEEQPVPEDCFPFADTLDPTRGAPLMITQRHEETLTLPDGVAFTLEPDQYVRLEMHFLNATEEPQELVATSTFNPIAPSEFEHEADFLFIGSIDIDLPPEQESTVGPVFFPLPGEYATSNFFAMTGHTHQLGTNVVVASTAGASAADTTRYDVPGWTWSEPDTVMFDPPFQVPPGGGFRFTCDYYNGTMESVGFGESTGDEMCFFWAYYYPSQGAKVCFHTDNFGGVNLCCPGSALCDQLF
jgi:hypothetical protein